MSSLALLGETLLHKYMRICLYVAMAPLSPPSLAHGAHLLKTLGNPVRLGVILELETHGHRCVHELVESLGVSQPLLSQHLRVLRAAQLIVGERHGREIRYSIADRHVTHIVHDAIDHAQEARP